MGTAPDWIAVAPDGKTVYVANSFAGTVTPIATATNTADAPIKVGGFPRTSRSRLSLHPHGSGPRRLIGHG